MEIQEASEHVDEMLKNTKIVYLYTKPDVLDFTCNSTGKIILLGGNKRIEININPENVTELVGFLTCTIFDIENIQMLIGWNFKSLFSYFRFHLKKPINYTTNLMDLMVVEKFMGIEKNFPEKFSEAINRVKELSGYKNWKSLYKSLHIPLMTQVLPGIETTPILDVKDKTSKFSYYEIEGQINGRLRSCGKFTKSYIPHNLSPEIKKNLVPRGENKIFLNFDVKHCEVNVLQYLSKDPNLKLIIDSGNDVYSDIYEIITEDKCDTDKKREMAKVMFIAFIYGSGVGRLGEILGVPKEVARELFNRINLRFPVASSWMHSIYEEAKLNGKVNDYFDRPRFYTEDTAYQARNFVVQSVAATVCLEKLIDLYKALNDIDAQLVYSIHDGYGVVSHKSVAFNAYKLSKKALELESKLCPGLFLKVECKMGLKLDSMKVFGK